MKIGILTFPNMTSYGCTLQMYALYRAVEQAGADAEIVHYQNPYMKAQRHTSAIQKRSGMAGKLRLMATKVLHARQIIGFRCFERRMVKYPTRVVGDKASLQAATTHYSGVICGSDQVWNPNITGGDLSYFLDFCGPNTKRIAYAPSFGISEFPVDFQNKITPELKNFECLSVREADGARLVTSLTGQEVKTVLDPTFLIAAEDWAHIEKTHPLAKGKYVLYFSVRKSPELLSFSRELAKKRNATLVVAEGNFLRILRNKDPKVKYALDLSPAEWLNLVHHADCVVTNSFHGAAFAIHYQKDFYLDFSSKTNVRLEQLMNICGLDHRVVGAECAPWDEHIDYEVVEARLTPERMESLAYLKQSIWQ